MLKCASWGVISCALDPAIESGKTMSIFLRGLEALTPDGVETPAESVLHSDASGAVVGASLRERALDELPASLGDMRALEILDLSGNRLAALPGWLGGLSGLRELLLDDNRLAALPPHIGALVNLRWL